VANKRIYEVARTFGISSEAFVKIVRELRFTPKSHMSVATEEMIAAVTRKFDIEKANAKKDIEHKKKMKRDQARAAAAKRTTPSSGAGGSLGDFVKSNSQTTAGSAAKTAGSATKLPSRRPDRPAGGGGGGGFRPGGGGGGGFRPGGGGGFRPQGGPRKRKRKGRSVDRAEVSKSFRSTMAQISGSQKTKKYRRRGATEDEFIEVQNIVNVTEFMTVGELAKTLEISSGDLIKKIIELGQMATINQRLDIDTIEMLCLEHSFGIEQETEIGEHIKETQAEGEQVKRPPVVTVMGHVDHGKTSLLDYIRDTNVVSGESGAITQHIGAYQVTSPSGDIVTFLDTPGHEAFTAMRARGAQVTDVVILVVAADDNVMPQTIEAIDHAKAAKAPIVVAINKIDKPEANIEKVRQGLANHGLSPEDWGGDTPMVPVSAKTGEGIDKLLEIVVLTADMLELKADPSIRAQGAIIESRLEKGRGPVATVLVACGSVAVGDTIVAGVNHGRVRTIINDSGKHLTVLKPGDPGQISGLNGAPQAGDSFLVVPNESSAREITSKRMQIKREYDYRRPRGHATLENIFSRIQDEKIKELPLLIKGDVDGSVEVLAETLSAIEHDEVRVRIVHKGVGGITESDILLAATSGAIIIGFHVGPTPRAREVAAREQVDIRRYSVIYEVEDDVRKALEGLLAPAFEERHVGLAEVRDIFKAPKVGLIAGCHVKDGIIRRANKVHLMRDGKKVFTGPIDSLRRFKDDVKEVQTGFECGIHIENFNDVKVGDTIETFEIIEVARTLQEG
jgi:translation initiation factor IF-2